MSGKVRHLNRIKIDQQVHINMKNKTLTFEDLEFKSHGNIGGATHAKMIFENGHKISVVGGGMGLYGDGVNTFEIWRSCDEDIKGHLTKEEVTEQMIELQGLLSGHNHSDLGYQG
jgi:hypothetical protein